MSVYDELKSALKVALRKATNDALEGRSDYQWVTYRSARLCVTTSDDGGAVVIRAYAAGGDGLHPRIYGWATFRPAKREMIPSWTPQEGSRDVRRHSGIAIRAAEAACWAYIRWHERADAYMEVCSAMC